MHALHPHDIYILVFRMILGLLHSHFPCSLPLFFWVVILTFPYNSRCPIFVDLLSCLRDNHIILYIQVQEYSLVAGARHCKIEEECGNKELQYKVPFPAHRRIP